MGLDRFSRQRLLPEVGDAGQAQIEEFPLRLPHSVSPEAREWAQVYGARAGHPVDPTSIESWEFPFPAASHFRHEAARAVAEGAYLSLENSKQALGLPSSFPSLAPPSGSSR